MIHIAFHLDEFKKNHPHLYSFVLAPLIWAIISYIAYVLWINIVPITTMLLGLNTNLIDYIYRQIAQGDGLNYQSTVMISLILGGFIGYLYRKNNSKEIQKPIIEIIASKVNYYISIVVILFLIIMSIYKYNITRDFNQDINIINPYITESDIQSIKSNFAQMQSRNDFNKIQETIKNIQLKNNLKNSKSN